MFAILHLTLNARGQSTSGEDLSVRKHLQLGQLALREQNADQAAREFNEVLRIDPKNVEAHANLGTLAFLHGDCVHAISELKNAIKLDPKLANTEALLGFCELRQGDSVAGRHDLEQAFPNATDPKLRVQTGLFLLQLYRQGGEVQKATTTINSLEELAGDNVDVEYAAYRLYSDLADQAVNAVSVNHGDSARMRQIVAQRLVEVGNLDGAVRAYRDAVKLDPHLTGVHFELAEALMHQHTSSQDEARQQLDAALADNPHDAEAESLLGELYMRAADDKAALDHYSKALAVQPNNPDARLGLGKLYLSSGKNNQALAEFQKVIAGDPTNAQAHYSASRAYSNLGRTEEADREIKIFESLRSSQHQLEEVFGHLRSGEGDDDGGPAEKK